MHNNTTNPSIVLSVRIDSAYVERLDQLAEEIGTSRSDAIRNALFHGIKRLERIADAVRQIEASQPDLD